MLESMLKICIYTGINADVTLEDGRTTECEDRARILKQNSQKEEKQMVKKSLNIDPLGNSFHVAQIISFIPPQ